MKEDFHEISDLLAISGQCKTDNQCCAVPSLIIFLLKKVNCVNVFNGACTTWSPGSPCASGPFEGGQG